MSQLQEKAVPGTVLPDLGKLPNFGEIRPMYEDKNYVIFKFWGIFWRNFAIQEVFCLFDQKISSPKQV